MFEFPHLISILRQTEVSAKVKFVSQSCNWLSWRKQKINKKPGQKTMQNNLNKNKNVTNYKKNLNNTNS